LPTKLWQCDSLTNTLMKPEYSIRVLHHLNEMQQLQACTDLVWGPDTGNMVSADFLMALSHAGGYVSGAFTSTDSGEIMVACSFGMLAQHRGDWCLHSHITGVIPELQNSGLGTAMKNHQKQWAIDAGLAAITWTFDPLVRRNAWFNIERLGANAVEFHINFYGPLNDEINGDDETDRLLARWDIDSPRARKTDADAIFIETPEDIVQLRRTNPDAARAWRLKIRHELSKAFTTHEVTGFTSEGSYTLTPRGKT
jgi:predicted GNAT superfamily acetyltransferase